MNRRLALTLLAALAAPAHAADTPSPLHVDDKTMAALAALRREPKFLDLPGAPAAAERRRLEPLIDGLLDRLIAGIQAHPGEAWVIAQMMPTVDAFHLEDTEARERCVDYIARIFRILGIRSDHGAFGGFWISIPVEAS